MSRSVEYKTNTLPELPQVDRRAGLSLGEFRKEYLYPRRPVVVTDAIEMWLVRSRWTMEYIKSRYPETQLNVFWLRREQYEPSSTENMRLGAFIERIQTHGFDTCPCYIRDDWQIFLKHKELLSDY